MSLFTSLFLLKAICKLTYKTDSGSDRGTAYYFRNLLNYRNVKGEVKNAYRAYKMLYYCIFDAICCSLFLKEFNIQDMDEPFSFPKDFEKASSEEKIIWLEDACAKVVDKYFFEGCIDIMEKLRSIVTDIQHPENYWISNLANGRVHCHHCKKTYKYVGSLKSHENQVHNVDIKMPSSKPLKVSDELNGYLMLLFKLVILHKNLDTAVDMADGERSVKSSKFELPIYNKTNKTKYAIGSIHLIAMTEGLLNEEQTERLKANRFVNMQGGINNNLALDEFVEILNRDSKVTCSGFQTKESIIAHSQEFPHLINIAKHFDHMCGITARKGFHHLPSYTEDVKKVVKELFDINAFSLIDGRKISSKNLYCNKSIYEESFCGLSTLILRHRPTVLYHRLRNKHV